MPKFIFPVDYDTEFPFAFVSPDIYTRDIPVEIFLMMKRTDEFTISTSGTFVRDGGNRLDFHNYIP